jgi:two-component system, OmpR family, alkaline phosphatase synthesis response regulator PhoP
VNTQNAELLVVDDDRDVCHLMAMTLKQVGYKVTEAYSGWDAVELTTRQSYDVLLTDINMPKIDGVQLMKRVKEASPSTAIILITGAPSLDSAVESIKGGAHSYLMKPCSSAEICAAVESAIRSNRKSRLMQELVDSIQDNVSELGEIARRMINIESPSQDADNDEAQNANSILKLGGISVYRDRYEMAMDDKVASLTPTEFDLLVFLMSNRSRIVSCTDLVHRTRGYALNEDEAREVIRPHISNLRRKFKQLGRADEALINVRGVGYRLADTL